MAADRPKSTFTSSALWHAAGIYGHVVLYIVLSTTTILYNKWILVYYGFDFPISLTMWHMFFTSCISAALVRSRYVAPVEGMTTSLFISEIVPIGACYALVLWLSNATYRYLSGSFVQMLQALVPITSFVIASMMKLEAYSHRMLACMLLVLVAVPMAQYNAIVLSMMGMFLGLTVPLFVSCRLILLEVLLHKRSVPKMNPITTLHCVAPCCLLFLTLPWAVMEAPLLCRGVLAGKVHLDVWVMMTNGMIAFALNLATIVLLAATSALTVCLVSVARSWALLAVSSWLFGVSVSPVNWVGYGLSVVAVVWYNNMKVQAGIAAHQRAEKLRQSSNDGIEFASLYRGPPRNPRSEGV